MTNLLDTDQSEIVIDAEKDYFADLVGEGKKFKTEKDLARAKMESDVFIERLQTENKGLRTELKGRVDSETSAARLAELVDKLSQREPPANNEPPTNENRERGVELTPEKIEELLERKLSNMSAAQKAEANVTFVKKKLHEKLGPGYAQHVRSQAEALGMSIQSLERLAADAPEAFLKLVTSGESRQSSAVQPVSSVNTSGFSPDVSGKRTESFYKKMKETDPNQYWDKRTQNQMHKDAIANSDTFFDVKR